VFFQIDADICWIYSIGMNQKPRRGRPPKSSGTKSESMLLRLEPEEKQGFSEAANAAGVPLSVWIRERLRVVARKELENVGKKAPFLPGMAPKTGAAEKASLN
jgi:hypothetical protein